MTQYSVVSRVLECDNSWDGSKFLSVSFRIGGAEPGFVGTEVTLPYIHNKQQAQEMLTQLDKLMVALNNYIALGE